MKNIFKFILLFTAVSILAACSSGGTGTPGNSKSGLKVVFGPTGGTFTLDMVIAEPAQTTPNPAPAGDVIITGTLDSNTGYITGTYNDTRFSTSGSSGPFDAFNSGTITPGNPAGTYTGSSSSQQYSFTIDSAGVITGSTATGGVVKSYKLTEITSPTLPSGVTRVTLTVKPANPVTSFTPSPIDITNVSSITVPNLTDNETYTFVADAYNASDVIIYKGSSTAVMLPLPATNPITITCTPYTAPAPTTATTASTWAAKTAMTTPRSRAASVQMNGLIYVLGGEDATGAAVNTFDVYDPATNAWQTLPAMPRVRRYAAAVAINTSIIIIGGEDSARIPIGVTDIYDTETGSWTQTGVMPLITPRARLSAVAYNGQIFAIGGTDASGMTPLANVEVLNTNITNPSWTPGPSLNTARARFSAIIAKTPTGNQIISIKGGDTAAGATASQEILTLAPIPASSWVNNTTLSLPAERAKHAAVVAGNTGYIIGGEDLKLALTPTVWTYDFTTSPNSFGTLSATGTFTPRNYPVVQSVNGKVYVIGGVVDSGGVRVVSGVVEELTPAGAVPKISAAKTAATTLYDVRGDVIDGTDFVMTGSQVANGPIFLEKLNPVTGVVTAAMPLNITPSYPADPEIQLAIGGGSYMVLAQEAGGLFVSRLDAANPVSVLNKQRIDTTVAMQATSTFGSLPTALAFGSNSFLAIYPNTTGQTYARFIDVTGNPVGTEFSIGAGGNVINAQYGNGIFVVLTAMTTGTTFSTVTFSATPIAPAATSAGSTIPVLSNLQGNNHWGDLAFNPNGAVFGVMGRVGNGTTDSIYATQFGTSGVNILPSGNVGMIDNSPTGKRSSHISHDGFKWCVEWRETDATGSGYGYYRFYDSNGVALNSKTAWTPLFSSQNGGGKIEWSPALNAYFVAWMTASGASFNYSTMQP